MCWVEGCAVTTMVWSPQLAEPERCQCCEFRSLELNSCCPHMGCPQLSVSILWSWDNECGAADITGDSKTWSINCTACNHYWYKQPRTFPSPLAILLSCKMPLLSQFLTANPPVPFSWFHETQWCSDPLASRQELIEKPEILFKSFVPS